MVCTVGSFNPQEQRARARTHTHPPTDSTAHPLTERPPSFTHGRIVALVPPCFFSQKSSPLKFKTDLPCKRRGLPAGGRRRRSGGGGGVGTARGSRRPGRTPGSPLVWAPLVQKKKLGLEQTTGANYQRVPEVCPCHRLPHVARIHASLPF